MWILTKRVGVAAVTGLAALGLMASQAWAQSKGGSRALPTGQFGMVNAGFGAVGGFGVNGSSYSAWWINAGVGGGAAGYFGGVAYSRGLGVYGGGFGAYGIGGAYGGGGYGAYGGGVYGASGASGGYPYGSYQEDSYGGYLRGSADVINSTGRYLINRQEAGRGRELVRQARIDTRRKAFDQYLYERDNTPTLEDERERLQALEVRRSLNDPPVTEIWSAKALNDLLRDVQKLQAKGANGPRLPLDEDLLKRVNVVGGRRAGNAALLKNQGKLTWPAALLSSKLTKEAEDLRQRINALLPDAVNQAINGKVDASILKQLQRDLGSLQILLARAVGRFPPDQYIEARRFLNDLEDGLRALEQPDVGLYITEKYAAKGHTVPELIDHMTREGLEFAPAVTGDEAAYVSLHRALATYDVAARARSESERAR
jgi:hypothetical protein